MPEPTNQKLYSHVKTLANKKFKSPSGIYRSSWIVREYKKRGGKYSGSKSKSSGLKRWFKENWIDLNRPKRNSKGKIIGYHKCGRKSVKSGGKYPLCRPSKRINNKTPKTYKQISKSSIKRAKKMKDIYKYNKNIVFKKTKKTSHKKSAKRSHKKSVKKSAKRSHKKSVKRSHKKSAKRSHKKSAKRSHKKSAKKSAKRSHKKSQSGGFNKKTAKFPRRFSKSYCLKRSCNKMGFTEKASCRYYKNCYKKK